MFGLLFNCFVGDLRGVFCSFASVGVMRVGLGVWDL